MSRRFRMRAGFTLIELLVVIAIISVLVALLLPAVQAAREAARRVQCVNNLMQLGVALHNYEASHEMLPPGVVDYTGTVLNVSKGYHHGWLVQLLPFLEQKGVANRVVDTAGIYAAENMSVRAISISVFLCPSDGGSRQSGTEPVVAMNNYAACHHDVEAPIDANNRGVFFLNSRVRSEDVVDGTSNTIYVGEKPLDSNDLGWASGTRATLRNTGSQINRTLTQPGGLFEAAEEDPIQDDPEPQPGSNSNSKLSGLVGGFGSNHPGGSNFGFGDGSVRFLKNSIKPEVYRNLGNRKDGEMISSEQF